MKFRLRCFSVLPIVLNIGLIFILTDMVTFRSIDDDSAHLTKEFMQRRAFEVNHKNNSNILTDFIYNSSYDYDTEHHTQGNQKTILLYNIPKNVFLSSHWQTHVQIDGLNCNNCAFTRDKSKLFTADAIIFYIGVRNERMGIEPPVTMELRNPNQVWIFTSFDPPIEYLNTDYETAHWQNMMNWSSLYRLDSDIPQPYGSLKAYSSPTEIDYESVFNGKTKNALWLVRQCQSASARRQYVAEMVNHGFDVDVLGICGIDGNTINTELLQQIIPKYKFYLAFETSLCVDFITERFFRNYNYNWIIVVRGGADYRRLLPTGTYVDSADFSNILTLVKYLQDLGNDKEKYINFLRRKNQYKSIIFGPETGMCEICKRLNNLSSFRKSYRSITDYLNVGQCIRPMDLQGQQRSLHQIHKKDTLKNTYKILKIYFPNS